MEEEKKNLEKSNNADASEAPVTESTPKAAIQTQKAEEAKENEIEEDIQEQIDQEKVEETPPIEIHYTIETASDEIDKFLSTLTNNDDHQTASPLEIPEVVWRFLDLFEEKIPKHDLGPDGKAKTSTPVLAEEDTLLFLDSVDRVTRLARKMSEMKLPENTSDQTYGVLNNRIGGVQQRAMSFLEDEFRFILDQDIFNLDHKKDTTKENNQETDPKPVAESDQSAEDPIVNTPRISLEVSSWLNKMAKVMISGGYESECVEIYIIARRNAFDESLNNLGFEKISLDDVQKMHWDTLEREIASWITTFSQCANVYFTGEQKLADVVFADQPMIASSLFSNLIRGVMIQLLNFAEALAMTKRSAEKLFKVLDMYECLRDNIPALNALVPDQCANELQNEMMAAKIRLGEAAIFMFCDLENSIKSDMAKTTVPGGAVHPLTRYTMNYLKYACEYKNTLEQVFREHWKIERTDSSSSSRQETEGEDQSCDNNNNDNNNASQPSPFAQQLVSVMDLLDQNLDAKSKMYKDVSLSSIFMMNNGRYILQKIKGSVEIHEAMGDTWCRKKSSDLRNYHKTYQRETWGRLLGCLGLDGLMVNGKVVKPVLKEKFKSFNSMFDEIHKTQSTWVVSDDQLQSELRVSISSVVIPAYRSFMGRFSQYLDPGRQTEKYIKYQPEDIETYIDELFDGKRKP